MHICVDRISQCLNFSNSWGVNFLIFSIEIIFRSWPCCSSQQYPWILAFWMKSNSKIKLSYLPPPFLLPRTWDRRRWGPGESAPTFEEQSWSEVLQVCNDLEPPGDPDLNEMGILATWLYLMGAFKGAKVLPFPGGPGPPSGGAGPSVDWYPGAFSKHGFWGSAGLAPVLGRITILGSEI